VIESSSAHLGLLEGGAKPMLHIEVIIAIVLAAAVGIFASRSSAA